MSFDEQLEQRLEGYSETAKQLVKSSPLVLLAGGHPLPHGHSNTTKVEAGQPSENAG